MGAAESSCGVAGRCCADMHLGGRFSDGRREARSGVRKGPVSDGQLAAFLWSDLRSGEQTAQQQRRIQNYKAKALARAGLLGTAGVRGTFVVGLSGALQNV